MIWHLQHPQATSYMLGFIPHFLYESDPRPAAEQFQERYVFGGWRPFQGFTMAADGSNIVYPGDPPMRLIAETKLREETIRLYECAWVAILQPDGSFEIAHMD